MPRLPRSLPRLSGSLLSSTSTIAPAIRPSFPSSALPTRSVLTSSRAPSLTPRLLGSSSSILSLLPSSAFASAGASQPQQVRFATYGAEYQPSQVRRKRKHGFLRRNRTKNGRKTLAARWAKGRRYLSH